MMSKGPLVVRGKTFSLTVFLRTTTRQRQTIQAIIRSDNFPQLAMVRQTLVRKINRNTKELPKTYMALVLTSSSKNKILEGLRCSSTVIWKWGGLHGNVGVTW